MGKYLRRLVFAALAYFACCAAVYAQQDAKPAAGNTTPCVEVEIGHDVQRSLDCLNQGLKNRVDQVQPTMNVPPIGAHSPDLSIGVVNVPGVQQQYGSNFGRSVIPQRPPAPVYENAFGRR